MCHIKHLLLLVLLRKLTSKASIKFFPIYFHYSIITNKMDNSENKENFTCEMEYLKAIQYIIHNGKLRSNRTGTDTMSVFGMQMRYDIRESFPLFTTKRVFWRGIVEEMLWFIQACTNSNKLADKNIHIWDANGSRDFLDKLGFYERETGN
ncbi:thymidylate synthase-like [Octopus bimaculoides]|uniref:thymidylate synthase-like n=1 Tax=Octopus bimaculoides TaxID=37653 RepID=UPI0022E6F50B|nr:thymidylate synthase-like [Octopus bimaculoides]